MQASGRRNLGQRQRLRVFTGVSRQRQPHGFRHVLSHLRHVRSILPLFRRLLLLLLLLFRVKGYCQLGCTR